MPDPLLLTGSTRANAEARLAELLALQATHGNHPNLDDEVHELTLALRKRRAVVAVLVEYDPEDGRDHPALWDWAELTDEPEVRALVTTVPVPTEYPTPDGPYDVQITDDLTAGQAVAFFAQFLPDAPVGAYLRGEDQTPWVGLHTDNTAADETPVADTPVLTFYVLVDEDGNEGDVEYESITEATDSLAGESNAPYAVLERCYALTPAGTSLVDTYDGSLSWPPGDDPTWHLDA